MNDAKGIYVVDILCILVVFNFCILGGKNSMTPEVEKIDKQKKQLFKDVYDNKIPERVPINFTMHMNVVAGFAGVHGRDALWNSELLTEECLKLADRLPSDVTIYGGNNHAPGYHQSLGSVTRIVSSTGFMQHPNTVGLNPEEYDIFIKNPIDCIIELVMPRNYRNLDFKKDPVRAMFSLTQALAQRDAHQARERAVSAAIREKHGGYAATPGTRGGCFAPVDIVTDNVRSLSGMIMDIKRIPDKVDAAVTAVYPLNYHFGKPPKVADYPMVNYPLHIGSYLRDKEFERFFWNPLMRQTTDYASLGIHTQLFCEHDYMPKINYLQDVPPGTVFQFEKCDPKLVKEKLGKKCILTGGFPLEILRIYNKQQCIDKTKEFLDIMMPGGGFIFQFDKSGLTSEDYNLENLQAVLETVRDYGVYKNAGEKASWQTLNPGDYKHSDVPKLTSKYMRTWEQYKEANPNTPDNAKQKVMDQEETAFIRFVYGLCQ